MGKDYQLEKNYKNNAMLKELLSKLPAFCDDFFLAIETRTTTLTRINYARDLYTFFEYLTLDVKHFYGREILSITVNDIDKLSLHDIETYTSYLTMYEKKGKMLVNTDVTKSRKISSVRTLLSYLYRRELIKQNIGAKVEMPKIREKAIIRLEGDEIERIIEEAETGDNLSEKQKAFNRITSRRDTAILTLLLGTGLRVSECVGLDIEDINFAQNALMITRKGEKSTIVYFSDEVKFALEYYYLERKEIKTKDKAFFLSIQNKRLGVRSIELLVKKYAKVVTPLKPVTPHKLRSTYGTTLYRETRDIYMVAQVLGHSDVNTTRKHYAAIDEDIKKEASDKVTLRKK